MEQEKYDLNTIYDLKDHPDISSGRCDNCNQAAFQSYIREGEFIRKCKNCGMMKSI